jgi:hypothetical protein
MPTETVKLATKRLQEAAALQLRLDDVRRLHAPLERLLSRIESWMVDAYLLGLADAKTKEGP